MLSGIVSHLQNVKGDAVDARLAQGVEPGDVRTSVVDLLQGRGHFGVVVVLELDRAEGRIDGEADEEQKGRKSYTIDHTILTYLMSDTNEYLTHLGANLGEQDLANLILEKINEDKREKLKHINI